jgi:hypothetical protein
LRHQLSITINGEPRDEVVLATPEPLNGVIDLTLHFERPPKSNGLPSLQTTADGSDYVDGAYRFRSWRCWPVTREGTYRARCVTLRFADGNTIEAPLSDEIVVALRPPAKADLPIFTAR